eukprot:SAG11_NODE_37438_length_257_cov_0.500000_1_plen_40_part_10
MKEIEPSNLVSTERGFFINAGEMEVEQDPRLQELKKRAEE